MSQPQPVRAGDVYPASADHHEARRERDKVIGQGQEEQRSGGLHVTETDLPAGKRMVTASAGGQVMAQFTVPVADRNVAEATDAVTVGEALQAAAQTREAFESSSYFGAPRSLEKSPMAKQKIVIKVQMASDRCRSRAMALVAATGWVDSVALAGDGKDQVVVVGEGVDSIKLTSALRKKIVSFWEADNIWRNQRSGWPDRFLLGVKVQGRAEV
ncbi:late embryogenesis abundant protein D-34-like [Panicum miliaceum]|uniref:Late embryogenesis abundant protein D-34-like n=1 Tax=Panicum miliaceum TaxID=4540 RepID=A0A3L6QCE6_PANMI|nr:late embryogenesis abundant protein D-34-like [Panicum miliaceum]